MMVIALNARVWDLLKLILPRSWFVSMYKPATEAQRAQSEAERNAIRKVVYQAKKLPGVDIWFIP